MRFLFLFLTSVLISTFSFEAFAQTQYPYPQTPYPYPQAPYSQYGQGGYAQVPQQPRQRVLRFDYVSVRTGGGVLFRVASDEDTPDVFGRFSILGGPVYTFVNRARYRDFYFIPEIGYSLAIRARQKERVDGELVEVEEQPNRYSHLAEFGARLGLGVGMSIDHIFSVDVFLRILVGGESDRASFGFRTGFIFAVFAHCISVEPGFMILTHFDGTSTMALSATASFDFPHFIMMLRDGAI